MSSINDNVEKIGQYIFAASYLYARQEYLLKKAMNVNVVHDVYSKQKGELEELCDLYISNIVPDFENREFDDFYMFLCDIYTYDKYEAYPLVIYHDAIALLDAPLSDADFNISTLEEKINNIMNSIMTIHIEMQKVGLILRSNCRMTQAVFYLGIAEGFLHALKQQKIHEEIANNK